MHFDLASLRAERDNLRMASRSITLPRSILKTIVRPAETTEITPPTAVEETLGRPTTPHLSYSQLAMYSRCPKQYEFRYGKGLKERPKVSLSIGKGGHAALDFNTKTKLRTGTDAPTEEVVQKASDMMDHYLRELPESEYEKDVEPGSTKDKFLSATRIHRLRDAPSIVPLGAEIEFNLDLNQYLDEPLEEPIRIVNGKIDLLYDDIGTRISHAEAVRIGVTDYKYVGRKKTQAEVDISPQLSLYNMVVRFLTGKWPTKAGLTLLHPGTTKEAPDSITMLRDPTLMTPESMSRRAHRVVEQFRMAEIGIRNGVFIPRDDPITCSWCGYRERCQDSRVDDFTAKKIRAATTT